MRFDATRASGWAPSFALPRAAGSRAERDAADLVAQGLESAGLQVHRAEIEGQAWGWEVRLTWSWLIGLGLIVPMGLLPPFVGSLMARCAFLGAGLAWLVIAPTLWRWLPRSGSLRTTGVMAARPSEEERPLRVVFVTSLDTPRRPISARWGRLARRLFFPALLMVLANVVLYDAIKTKAPRGAAPALAFTFELSLIFWTASHVRWTMEDGERDNRDGIATLLELARSWPPRGANLVETWFVANGGLALDSACLDELGRVIREDWPSKPTLVVGLWSPGLGPPFALVPGSLEAWELAEDAADGLRIPLSESGPSWTRGGLPAINSRFPDMVLVVGMPGPGAVIRPESLALAAQLGTEIVLRWVRKETASKPSINRA